MACVPQENIFRRMSSGKDLLQQLWADEELAKNAKQQLRVASIAAVRPPGIPSALPKPLPPQEQHEEMQLLANGNGATNGARNIVTKRNKALCVASSAVLATTQPAPTKVLDTCRSSHPLARARVQEREQDHGDDDDDEEEEAELDDYAEEEAHVVHQEVECTPVGDSFSSSSCSSTSSSGNSSCPMMEHGSYIRMGWLNKQGHVWKTWKDRFFVLYCDGTFAYYGNKGKKKSKGSVSLNDGVISIQYVDVRKAGRPYAFQIVKGYYRLMCSCCSQVEAELWVNALRSIRRNAPQSLEVDVTATEEKPAFSALSVKLNKIFVTDGPIMSLVEHFKTSLAMDMRHASHVMTTLEDLIVDRHLFHLQADPHIGLLPGSEILRLVRRCVEDRVFVPRHPLLYRSLMSRELNRVSSRATRNIKLLKKKNAEEFEIPKVLWSTCDWNAAVEWISAIDCVSLPSLKLEFILRAAKEISQEVKHHNGSHYDLTDDSLSIIFRYLIVAANFEDIALQRKMLEHLYLDHPVTRNKTGIVEAFLHAIVWIEEYQNDKRSDDPRTLTLENSRKIITFSTKTIGIQFETDGYNRCAIVRSIKKQSQADLCGSISAGYALIAINDTPVLLMTLPEICEKISSAALPKRLTFLTEFYYYQLLSLDHDLWSYMLCQAASRGDLESVQWFCQSHTDATQLCSWEKTRGKQVFSFKPPSVKGSALHAAVLHGHYEVVTYLLRLGVDANLVNRKGKTPLHLVTSTIDVVRIIEALMEFNAQLDAIDNEGFTPLMRMCEKKCFEGATTMIALGADLHKSAWSNGYTALLLNAHNCNVELVHLCLLKGAEHDAADFNGNTSLHEAAASANAAIIDDLIKHGANVNIRNRFGQTPAAVLLCEGALNHTDTSTLKACLELLLLAGARVDLRDLWGRQLIHLAYMTHSGTLRHMVHLRYGSRGTIQNTPQAVVDIFGFSTDVYHFRMQGDLVAEVNHTTPVRIDVKLFVRQREEESTIRSLTVEEMLNWLVNSVSIDMADCITFTLLLRSFSSIDRVINLLQNERPSSPGLLRMLIFIYCFEEESIREQPELLQAFEEILQKTTGLAKTEAWQRLHDYITLYRDAISLRGSHFCLDQYQKIPLHMAKYYGDELYSCQEPFQKAFHRTVNAHRWAEHCTLLTHALFTTIPMDDFLQIRSKKQHSREFCCAKRWFQHLTAYVVNAILLQETPEERAASIEFFAQVAEHLLHVLKNFDTLAAILYALQSTAIQRLGKTMQCLNEASKRILHNLQFLSDKGCREMSQLIRKASNPSMPYTGLYLQHMVGLNELPVFNDHQLLNGKRLRKVGDLAMEILYRKTAPYAIEFDDQIDKLLHVNLPLDSEETRYNRSLDLEPRSAQTLTPVERAAVLEVQEKDLESEVRESIGTEGTFGIRQWLRKQKVVRQCRSRLRVSSSSSSLHEWV